LLLERRFVLVVIDAQSGFLSASGLTGRGSSEWLRMVDAATDFRGAHPELGDPPRFSLYMLRGW
jgi:hypothetical protein